MVKRFKTASAIVLLLVAFSPVSAQTSKQSSPTATKANLRFLDDIEVGYSAPAVLQDTKSEEVKNAKPEPSVATKKELTSPAFSIEKVSSLQLKFSILLDTEVESIQNSALFQKIDEWYGTRYVYGGASKNGIDCSAFMQVLFSTVMGVALPRTAKEQYGATRPVREDEELKEGDLVFFNTTGGISHVGMYLQNNKFVHAATSGGVMISDLDEAYWAKRLLGFGRYERIADPLIFVSKP